MKFIHRKPSTNFPQTPCWGITATPYAVVIALGLHDVVIELPQRKLTPDAQDGVTGAATLSGLYNCNVCGQEKCVEPGICDDCLAPPTEFEINQWRDGEATPPVI